MFLFFILIWSYHIDYMGFGQVHYELIAHVLDVQKSTLQI